MLWQSVTDYFKDGFFNHHPYVQAAVLALIIFVFVKMVRRDKGRDNDAR